MTFAPLTCRWDGEGFVPVGRYASEATKKCVIGQIYRIAEWADRSDVTHKHEFAWLREAWSNLPEQYADMYPSAEHLRKRALIQAGFYNEQIIDAGTNAAALRVAAGFRSHDDFCMAVVRGGIVAIRTAKSQSRRAMNKAEFQKSKSAIMEIIAEMVGVSTGDLEQNAGKAA